MSEEKTGWKDYVFMITVVSIVIIVVFSIGQLQENNSKPQGIGSEDNEFWTRSTNHPSWAVNAVQNEPVLIFAHSVNCAPCITQTEICESIDAKYSANILYYDFISGVDTEASDCFSAYDPDGPPSYIPLTIVLTKGPDNTILWHSWEGVVEEPVLTSWIDDAISYHNDNSG